MSNYLRITKCFALGKTKSLLDKELCSVIKMDSYRLMRLLVLKSGGPRPGILEIYRWGGQCQCWNGLPEFYTIWPSVSLRLRESRRKHRDDAVFLEAGGSADSEEGLSGSEIYLGTAPPWLTGSEIKTFMAIMAKIQSKFFWEIQQISMLQMV